MQLIMDQFLEGAPESSNPKNMSGFQIFLLQSLLQEVAIVKSMCESFMGTAGDYPSKVWTKEEWYTACVAIVNKVKEFESWCQSQRDDGEKAEDMTIVADLTKELEIQMDLLEDREKTIANLEDELAELKQKQQRGPIQQAIDNARGRSVQPVSDTKRAGEIIAAQDKKINGLLGENSRLIEIHHSQVQAKDAIIAKLEQEKTELERKKAEESTRENTVTLADIEILREQLTKFKQETSAVLASNKAEIKAADALYKQAIAVREPLLQVGIAVRQGYMEIIKTVRMDPTYPADIQLIDDAKSALRFGNYIADKALFDLGVCTSKLDIDHFTTVYKLPPGGLERLGQDKSVAIKKIIDTFGTFASYQFPVEGEYAKLLDSTQRAWIHQFAGKIGKPQGFKNAEEACLAFDNHPQAQKEVDRMYEIMEGHLRNVPGA